MFVRLINSLSQLKMSINYNEFTDKTTLGCHFKMKFEGE